MKIFIRDPIYESHKYLKKFHPVKKSINDITNLFCKVLYTGQKWVLFCLIRQRKHILQLNGVKRSRSLSSPRITLYNWRNR